MVAISTEPMATTSAETLDAPLTRTRAQDLLDNFASFRSELDAHQDRRERIIKTSRDITALSKKLIFTLHRITNTPRAVVLKEAESKLKTLRDLFVKVQSELQRDQFWRYEKAISPGMQEYLEGWTFYYYILHRRIPTLAEAQASLVPPTSDTNAENDADACPTPYVRVTEEDYLGGIADLTGELMRLAIASIGKSLAAATGEGERGEDIDDIGRLVRGIKGEMDPLAPYARWLGKKLVVLDQSLSKIELASYNLKVRGAEFPDAQPRWNEQDDHNRRD